MPKKQNLDKGTQATLVAMQKQIDEQAERQKTFQDEQANTMEELKQLLMANINRPQADPIVQDAPVAPPNAPIQAVPVTPPTPASLTSASRSTATEVKAPRTFNFSVMDTLERDAQYSDFRRWKKAWDNNARVYNLPSFPREQQVAALISAVGPFVSEVIEKHCHLELDDETTTVETIFTELQEYYRSEGSLAVERVKFHQRKQGDNETFNQFRFDLLNMADDADLCGHCKDAQIVTQIIVGTNDEKARHDLLREPVFPTLQKAIDICHNSEVANRNNAKLESSSINKISSYKQERKQNWNKNHDKKQCSYCGSTPWHERERCQAKNKTCGKCGKLGHFQSVCRSEESTSYKKRSTVRTRFYDPRFYDKTRFYDILPLTNFFST